MPELNDEQTRELNRADKLLKFLNQTGNPAIWNPYLPFASEVTLLQGYVDAIDLLVPKKEQSGKTITLSKEELKATFAKDVGGLFSITGVYAKKYGDATLEGQVKKSESDIGKMKDTEIMGFANGLRSDIYTDDLLANVDFVPYGITLTMVTDAIGVASDFNDKIGISASITVASDTANTSITDIVTNMRKSVATMLDLKSHFNESFVTGLEKAAVRDDIGVRHTGILATITSGGVGVKGGKLTIGKKTYESSDSGNVKPMYLTQGKKNVTVELEGKPTKSFVHQFIKGQVDKMNFDF